MITRLSAIARAGSLTCLLMAASIAQAAAIGGSQITASTTLGQFSTFSIDKITDGITSDAPPFNGYAPGIGVLSGRITLTLDGSYDLDSFALWNDINVLNEGVRTFTLTFLDADGMSLGSTGTLMAVSQLAAQTYSFASTVFGAKTVYMDVLTSSVQLEIREVAFNGNVSAVPEPTSTALLAAGLAAMGGFSAFRAGVSCRRTRTRTRKTVAAADVPSALTPPATH